MSKPSLTLKEIFDQAQEIDSVEDRTSFLDQVCAGDTELREKVESLLRAFEEAGSFLQRPAFRLPDTGPYRAGHGAAGPLSSIVPETDIGQPRAERLPAGDGPAEWIGPYRLVEKLGEGGMGEVYLAEQEHPIRRQVALKLIKEGMDSASIVARFEAERQALTMMDHANIARVYEAGTTPAGLPYFVMELVKGMPMNRFCDDNMLDARERLRLFETVCEAIQHAHQKGVIHRDIKPSNVLVAMQDGKPAAKVIDFGLAKATEKALTDHSQMTQFGSIVGTLEYMSPEQADGGVSGIDTRTDIYSLGVMLYELLTGTTPLARTRKSDEGLTEVLRRIKEEEPPRPSARASSLGERLPRIATQRKTEPGRLVKLLRGELDWIALRALEKDRTRRYETASGLAKDVRRYLDDEPVEACPPSARYRLGKFARKNRTLLASAVVVAAMLLTGIAGLVVGIYKVNNARDKAVKAEKGTLKALYMSDAVIQAMIRDGTKLSDDQRTILRNLLPGYRQFLLELGDSPEVRPTAAITQLRLGDICLLLDEPADAEESYQKAIQLYEKLAKDSPDIAHYRNDLAKTYHNLAIISLQLGKRPEAEAAFLRAIELHEKLAGEFPAEESYRTELANHYNNLGTLLRDRKEPVEAEHAYHRAIALGEKLILEDPSYRAYRMNLATYYQNLGNAVRDQEKVKAAVAWYDKAIELLAPMKKSTASASLALRNAYWDRANALGQLEQHARASQDWNSAIELDNGSDQEHLRRFLDAEQKDENVKAKSKPSGELLYAAAAVHGRAVTAADKTGEPSLKERYVKRAFELLKQAKTAGWFRDPWRIKQLKNDKSFSMLPGEEYKRFVDSLEADPAGKEKGKKE